MLVDTEVVVVEVVVVEIVVVVGVDVVDVEDLVANKLHLQSTCFPSILTGHAKFDTKFTAACQVSKKWACMVWLMCLCLKHLLTKIMTNSTKWQKEKMSNFTQWLSHKVI